MSNKEEAKEKICSLNTPQSDKNVVCQDDFNPNSSSCKLSINAPKYIPKKIVNESIPSKQSRSNCNYYMAPPIMNYIPYYGYFIPPTIHYSDPIDDPIYDDPIEDDPIVDPLEEWEEECKKCCCCKGWIYSCKGEACEYLGKCFCKVKIDIEKAELEKPIV